jgi:hypothetical protein
MDATGPPASCIARKWVEPAPAVGSAQLVGHDGPDQLPPERVPLLPDGAEHHEGAELGMPADDHAVGEGLGPADPVERRPFDVQSRA